MAHPEVLDGGGGKYLPLTGWKTQDRRWSEAWEGRSSPPQYGGMGAMSRESKKVNVEIGYFRYSGLIQL